MYDDLFLFTLMKSYSHYLYAIQLLFNSCRWKLEMLCIKDRIGVRKNDYAGSQADGGDVYEVKPFPSV
jgi:hypothetical protein